MSAYYNEHDPKAAAWLRELIANGLIAPGEVDERSIADVTGNDVRGFCQCHFFAGIGGWSLALRLAGWPDDKPVWTGSCPCQPFSCAGKGLGTKDIRHLWPEFDRLIGQCSPAIVFGEQVASRAGREWLAGVFADLEGMGYAAAGADLCAASVGAPHIRQRLFWMADAEHPIGREVNFDGEDGCDGQDNGREEAHRQPGTCGEVQRMADAEPGRCQKCDPGLGRVQQPAEDGQPGFWSTAIAHPCRDGKARQIPSAHGLEPVLQRVVDGFPGSLDNSRAILNATQGFPLSEGIRGRVGLLKGFGNAIVPQVASQFIKNAMQAIEAISDQPRPGRKE